MAAPKGNKFAETWTREKALELVEEALQILMDNEELFCAGEVAAIQKQYRQLYGYLFEKFDDEVFNTIKNRFENILETRMYVLGAKNKINPTMAIFGLKNNFNWKDKTEVDTKVDMHMNVDPFKQIRDNSEIDETDQ
ncbi:hypothetical protein [Massilibacteroides sp.]|uniref:hypothetical protein n=1 Tax=Massilibacteroides sp. TaxID=2034766 RepID=UPI00262A9FCB|nr:hypothetical protein [Massilibacteroides sp.]MDD4515655.1 hypothetical protein [Massilibacteroides sp.]